MSIGNVRQNGEGDLVKRLGWWGEVKLFLAKPVWTRLHYTNKKSESKEAFNWANSGKRSSIQAASFLFVQYKIWVPNPSSVFAQCTGPETNSPEFMDDAKPSITTPHY